MRFMQIAGKAPIREPAHLEDVNAIRPDIMGSGDGSCDLVDTTVVHPGMPSNLRHAMRPLGLADRAEQQKRHKYAAFARSLRATVIGFAMETYGALGNGAKAFIKKLADSAGQRGYHLYSRRDFLYAATTAVSVAMHEGNAWCIQEAIFNERRLLNVNRPAAPVAFRPAGHSTEWAEDLDPREQEDLNGLVNTHDEEEKQLELEAGTPPLPNWEDADPGSPAALADAATAPPVTGTGPPADGRAPPPPTLPSGGTVPPGTPGH